MRASALHECSAKSIDVLCWLGTCGLLLRYEQPLWPTLHVLAGRGARCDQIVC